MALPLKHLVPYLLLLSIMSFTHARAKPCKCPDNSDQDQRSNHTMDGAGSEFYLIDRESRAAWTTSPSFLRNLRDSLQRTIPVCAIIDERIGLWQVRPGRLGVDDASFSVTIVYQPLPDQRPPGLAFLILPYEDREFLERWEDKTFREQDDGSPDLSRVSRNATVSGSSVSVAISQGSSSAVGMDNPVITIYVKIDAAAASTYAVWIDYDDRAGRRLSVYVDEEANPKPYNTIAEVNLNVSGVAGSHFYYFGILSTVAQQLSVRSWNATVQDLPYYPDKAILPDDPDKAILPDKVNFLSSKITILYSSVLGSVAATSVMAAAVVCYFNSRYRRWQKDLEQLARSMERLPGMPTKVEFADIKKATGNFHETMKLGGGGFGMVYRCTLPATASKTERPMDVAVKRFTRDVQNRRYDDFLAEVSIINRLRHKNIVPLVGWSYKKGEPLLVFEFMTNGSLDQHLFRKGGSGTRNPPERPTGASIWQWATRYEIVKDIATGLHYVHHEYEPMVLHRDIKASNVMLDSSFGARLGDFGLACTVDVNRNSATGVAGTWGYIAPEYAVCRKATRQTDIFALGVLILEVVTGKMALIHQEIDEDDIHITDRVWRIYREGRLRECIDARLIAASSMDEKEEEQLNAGGEAERLLLLGLACSSPNPSERPTMPEVMQVIAKSVAPPTVPLMKPRFVWPPPEWMSLGGDDSASISMTSNLDSSSMASTNKLQSRVTSGMLTAQVMSAGKHATFCK